MLRNGSSPWHLLAFGLATLCGGLYLWHGQGTHYGLGVAGGRVSWRAAYVSLAVCVLLVAIEVTLAGE
jgi:hypothetical protein